MLIQTKDFGMFEIDENEILHFPQGLYSFEEFKNFVLIEKDDCPALWLQSVDDINPRFIVFNPKDILKNYRPKVLQSSLKVLEAKTAEELSFFVIAVIPSDIKKMTVNLKSPVAINFKKHLAMQVMLENEEYGVRYPVYAQEKGEQPCL
jgi:flagellar assembly factor FliW